MHIEAPGKFPLAIRHQIGAQPQAERFAEPLLIQVPAYYREVTLWGASPNICLQAECCYAGLLSWAEALWVYTLARLKTQQTCW